MNGEMTDPRIDRLYELMPDIHRMRDADQRYPLRALLRVIAEQVNLAEDDISQLYDNWFIETAEDWAVPYIADLLGYRPVLGIGDTSGTNLELTRVLVPRREVANTIGYRSRKGTAPLLELLAQDVAGLPARVVEFFKLLGWNQNLNHPHFERARTVDIRRMDDLDLIGGPFERLTHSVDIRRINSRRAVGRFNIPSIGVFVWWLKAYAVTRTRAYCAENAGPHCFTFSVLGQDAPLFCKAEPETDPSHVAEEVNVPAQIRRFAFQQRPQQFYGADRSFAIWAGGWNATDPDKPIPVETIIPADLTGWSYVPPKNHVAVDPVLGRFAFPPSQLPKKGVKVSYRYGFSADMGGGEYSRPIFDPSAEVNMVSSAEHGHEVREVVEPVFYRVGRSEELFQTIGAALTQWQKDDPYDAVIELTESGVFVEPISLTLKADRTLQLRAANRARPVLRLIDWETDSPDALSVTMEQGSRFTMDGLLVTGRPLRITGPYRESSEPIVPVCGSSVAIRHCTFVPGWGIDSHCQPNRPAEPSLELYNIRARVRIEHSIIGSIQVHEDEVKIDPIPLHISDSIVDATEPRKEAIGAPGYAVAHVVLTILRTTIFGIVDVHAVELAENCIFMDCLNVARRQLGCMRFSYVPPGCRTPRRYRCQPDLVTQAVNETVEVLSKRPGLIASEVLRVRPQFTSNRYGSPAYAQLARTCAEEIKQGADDESEMGAFHDLYRPQREANLRQRLEEFVPAGMDVGLLYPD
jgi:hypothetical protein